MKGADRPLPFQALVQAEACAPATVNGVMLEEQVLPGWLLPAIATVGVIAAAAVALWFTVLKPQVHSIASAAASSAAAPMASAASSANNAAQSAESQASAIASKAGVTTGGSGSPSPSPGQSGSPTPNPKKSKKPGTVSTVAAPVPVSHLLSVSAPPSTTFVTETFPIPKGKTLTVSDIVFENPAGDNGLMQVRMGTTPIFVFGLANFRSFEYPFAQPLVFTHAAPLVLAVQCGNQGKTACADAVSFNGFMQPVPQSGSGQGVSQ